ncbi:transposase [Planotetraspora sp. GP83]|uniref:transposase n=1 Tax=Planotetraspora sp. GP83 TaxID=3156264 RepID=UPI00351159DE
MSRWVGVGGWEVAVVELDGRAMFRMRHLGYHICYAGSVADVARHLDLADLVEVVELRR